jgi:Icc-related predicted phosphoesterase
VCGDCMKMLVIADLHGYSDEISDFFKKIDATGFDLIVCPGDFTDMFNQPPGFSQHNIANLILQKLISFGVPLLCVPGNHDPYEIIDVFEEYDVNLHGKVKRVGGETFVGWGGALTPFHTAFEPTEEETREALENMGKKAGDDFILVLHNPPRDTKLDRTPTGEHVGSPTIRDFIEKRKPKLVISAHIHESSGEDRIGESLLFYPGPFYTGRYGVVSVRGGSIKCEIKRVSLRG